jgi:FKBP-type peptidyl-prolyl cis-trans isomerase FkpA
MKILTTGLILAGGLALGACKGGTSQAPATQTSTAPAAAAAGPSEDEKTFYAAGFMLGRNLSQLGLTPVEIEAAKKGLADAALGKQPEQALETYGPKIQAAIQLRQAKRAEAEKAKAQTFLENAAKEAGATKTASGLIYTTITPGTGKSPAATDVVKVNYRGTLIDGTEFDSSYKHNQPAEFLVSQVVPCWREGVQKMKVGEKAKLVCPSSIAYGDQGSPPTIPGGATLVFELELLSVGAAPAAPAAPAPKK